MSARILRRLSAALLSAVIGATAAAGGALAAEPAASAAPQSAGDSWIVTLRSGYRPDEEAAGLARGAGGKAGLIYRHALAGFVFHGSAQAARALERNPKVRTVVADGPVAITDDGITTGVSRVSANPVEGSGAYQEGFRGAGARIAILDTGIDLTHPDLASNVDTALGLNCMTTPPGTASPQDDHGHGTHVAGIAAAPVNGVGVVGVAPEARLVPIKVLDATGHGEWSNVICGIDHLTSMNLDADPANDITVANMSLGDVGEVGNCEDGFVREAICTSVAAGITYVAAAGNSTVDTSTFIPAAMPEVIAVSSITDLDGRSGGLAGCLIPFLNFFCDDSLSEFSNFGLSVDVAAPGYEIYSTWIGGGYSSASGTSMASPHAAGVAALVLAENPALAPADVGDLLEAVGECADGTTAEDDGDDCAGNGQWRNDPDGYGEPVVHALRAAETAAVWNGRPSITITSPADGASVEGPVVVTADATDDVGIVQVEFLVNGSAAWTDVDEADGWSFSWDTAVVDPGRYTITATATDTTGGTRSDRITVALGTNLQGDWVGNYGVDGHLIGAWNGSSDLNGLPSGVTYALEQGTRYTWGYAGDIRATESPNQAERRSTAWYDAGEVRLRLTFSSAYSGVVHLYMVDWGGAGRRQDVTLDDGAGPRTASLTTSFLNGAWVHFPVTVNAGGTVTIRAINRAGATNAVLGAVFLGGPGVTALPIAVPSEPTGLIAAAGDAHVALSWLAPASNGGSPITSYIVTATPGGATCTSDSLGCAVTGLTNGTTYSFAVRAANSVGIGPPSAPAGATPATVPGAPTGLVASAGNGQVALNWLAPASDGGSAISSYTATASPGGATCTTSGLGCTISGLTNGTSYSVTVRASNAIGSGPASGSVSATPATVPGAPTGLVATALRPSGIRLTWSAPTSNGGSSVTGYQIYRSTVKGAETPHATVGLTTTFTDLATASGVRYYYRVAAINVIDSGPLSAEVSARAR
jgi:subtilisin family serine protease